jgi:hypothetical protein
MQLMMIAAATCVQVQDAAVPQALCLQAQHLLLCTLRGRTQVSTSSSSSLQPGSTSSLL